MTLSVLLYALMVSTFVALVGVLVVDAVGALSRSRPAAPDPDPRRSAAEGRRRARTVAAQP